MQPKSFFAKANMSITTSQKASLAPSQKERILFKIATFAFRFFDGTLPPYLSSCPSVYTPSHTLRCNSNEKKLFPVQHRNSRALVTGRSLFRRPLSGTLFLPTSDTVAPSHSSKLPLRHSSSLLPSPSYLDSLEDFIFSPPHRLLMFVCC